MNAPPATLRWDGDVSGRLVLLDQTRLPGEVVELECRAVEDVWHAIRRLAVRGAPAIGVAAAYGVCQSLTPSCSLPLVGRAGEREQPSTGDQKSPVRKAVVPASPLPNPPHQGEGTGSVAVDRVLAACDYLATSRPTAVNLFWALDRMRRVAVANIQASNQELAARLLAEARAIHDEDRHMCEGIARHGADLLADLPVGAGVLTHCNAGALATGGDGTALGVIFELARRGRRPHVWVDETRPLLQGARLTAWELTERGIDCTLICDSMAGEVMREGRVQSVIVGADRIAANGDAANKIGTYGVAVLAEAHGIPFYVAAPTSTFDLQIAGGAEIPIEQRAAVEITHPLAAASSIAPAGVAVYNPAFDVTPARLIRAIITERGAFDPRSIGKLAPGQ